MADADKNDDPTSEANACQRKCCPAPSLKNPEVLGFMWDRIGALVGGLEIDEAVEVETDNKGAHDLCHRYSAAQHSKHIDRKMYKMREMRGAKIVTVKYIPTGDNTADMWTKVLSRQPFEKHRRTVLNL